MHIVAPPPIGNRQFCDPEATILIRVSIIAYLPLANCFSSATEPSPKTQPYRIVSDTSITRCCSDVEADPLRACRRLPCGLGKQIDRRTGSVPPGTAVALICRCLVERRGKGGMLSAALISTTL